MYNVLKIKDSDKMRIRIYTDGACSRNPGPGGYAAIILKPDTMIRVSGNELNTTNNRMELKAVVESLKAALKLPFKRFDVYSDSAYVVNAVKCGWVKRWQANHWKTVKDSDVKNKDLWLELLKLLNTEHVVNIVKVKGHDGDFYNDAVDRMAKQEVQCII